VRKPKNKPIWCALKKTKSGSRGSLDVDAGHEVPSPQVLAPEAKAPISPATMSKDSCHSGCSPPSHVGAGGSSPSAIWQLGSSFSIPPLVASTKFEGTPPSAIWQLGSSFSIPPLVASTKFEGTPPSAIWQLGSSFSIPPLVASTKFEGTSLADMRFSSAPLVASPTTVSNVGSFSLGASSSVIACSVLQSSNVLPLQVSSCITSSQSFSGAVELGKMLHSSSPVLSDSKPFQKYYRKAKEARKVHLDEKFFADSMEALRPVAQVLGFLSLLLDPAKKAIVVLPMQDSASAEVSVKGFLRRGFLNPSPVVQANLSHKVSVVSASTLGFPTAIKGEDFRVNDLTQSQKWPVSFSPSREVVA
jgi:hypothetical protein